MEQKENINNYLNEFEEQEYTEVHKNHNKQLDEMGTIQI